MIPLEKEMATHSRIPAWEIPQREEPGRLQSMGLQKSWIQLSNWTTTESHKGNILAVFTCLHPTPVLLPGKSRGRRSLLGCSPWGHWGSDTTERLHFHFSLSCIGEGNGNPLQCSCLENPRDGGTWWAAVYRVAQSQTRLKWLSSNTENPKIMEKASMRGRIHLLKK